MNHTAARILLKVLDMATSSITRNFVVSGTKQVEMFANINA